MAEPLGEQVDQKQKPCNVEGNDAVCFTAGFEGAAFGAGTTHAYLAADRKAPAVVAGISLGAVNAAAMQRAYRLLAAKSGAGAIEREAARWNWFREYLHALSDQPLNIIWNGIPDQSDFFADMEPIHDPSMPAFFGPDEAAARRKLYLLVKLGRWLASVPVSISRIAGLLVSYVRARERYSLAQKLSAGLRLFCSFIVLATQIILHACISPQFFPEQQFPRQDSPGTGETRTGVPQAGLGFLSWLNSFTLSGVAFVIASLLGFVFWVERGSTADVLYGGLIVIVLLLVLAGVTARMRRWLMRRPFVQHWILPWVGRLVYLFSWINLGLVLMFVTGSLWLAVEQAESMDFSPAALILFFVGGFFLVTVSLPVLPFLVIPEIRRWLIDRGLLKRVPRPLFGWGIFIFLWVHLLSLVSYLMLAGRVEYTAVLNRGWFELVGRIVILTVSIFLVPWIPIMPIFLMTMVRRALRIFGLINPRWSGRLVNGLYWIASFSAFLAGCWIYWRFLLIIGGHVGALEARALQIQFYVAAIVLSATWLAMAEPLFYPPYSRWLAAKVSRHLGLSRSLIHDFHLRLRLAQLFDPPSDDATSTGNTPTVVDNDPMPIVIVAAPLQTLYRDGKKIYANQLWAKRGTPLIQALRAAVSMPPLFEPVRLHSEKELGQWLEVTVSKEEKNRNLDLVDGAVIRQNPLPALFLFVKREPGLAARLAGNNSEKEPAVHVVYRVPIEEKAVPSAAENRLEDTNTIVDVGLLSMRLSQRCDTQVEVEQANFISRFAAQVPNEGDLNGERIYSIFADEIAPENDFAAGNPLNPGAANILKAVAEGCQRTLQTVCRTQLQSFPGYDPDVDCGEFLQHTTNGSRNISSSAPGLPEVCAQCTRKLKRPSQGHSKPVSSVASASKSLGDQRDFVRLHPNLSGGAPRIAFVASGGVFRGAFHIGMLGALQTCKIQPDLIVGASVGTLMCGALGAMFCTGPDVLGRLVEAFLRVDEEVALTKTLKAAARELGLRGRAVKLSPRQIRRMVRRGSRSDAGYAAVGAPPAVVDAISDLFMIPHSETGKIAAKFIAGHVTDATHEFLSQIKKETLRRLDIRSALIGTSLLEHLAKDILGARRLPPGARQPFQGKGIAYFGTTTNLITQSALLLGGYDLHKDAPYDYVEAALASSAFPAVFAPRPESNIFPGIGRTDVLFADGGMFDNLPFLPAIEILSWGQLGYRLSREGQELTALRFLQRRHEKPDLIIAGALNAVAEDDPLGDAPFDSLPAIRTRAASLAHNVKIRGFEESSDNVHKLVEHFIRAPDPAAKSSAPHFVDSVVHAAALSIFPASPEHLNPTFAFCASTGLKERRVLRSIANGCFETLYSFAEKQAEPPNKQSFAGTAVNGLADRIPNLTLRSKLEKRKSGECPYFNKSGAPLACPFVAEAVASRHPKTRHVYATCKREAVHWKKIGGFQKA